MSTNAKIISIERSGSVVKTTVDVDHVKSEPLAPASLNDGNKAVINLHKLVSVDGHELTFESYDVSEGASLPKVGNMLMLTTWWAPWQLDLAKSDKSQWTKMKFPEHREHVHCVLSWETISAEGDYIHEAYTNGEDWIAPDAFDRFIIRDEAHLCS